MSGCFAAAATRKRRPAKLDGQAEERLGPGQPQARRASAAGPLAHPAADAVLVQFLQA